MSDSTEQNPNPTVGPISGEIIRVSPVPWKLTDADAWKRADEIWERARQAEAGREASQQHTSPVTQYLLLETNPEHDERHSLSQALERWILDGGNKARKT